MRSLARDFASTFRPRRADAGSSLTGTRGRKLNYCELSIWIQNGYEPASRLSSWEGEQLLPIGYD